MRTTKVLIVEDQVTEASHLKETLSELGYQVTAVARSLAEGLEYFSSGKPDISLVDIYLNGKPDGIVFGMKMNEQEVTKKPFLFLTSSTEPSTFTLAKNSKPYSYLLKPFNKPELEYAIELALERSRREEATGVPAPTPSAKRSVFVKRGNTLHSVLYDEIQYIEVDGKYSKLVCNNQKFVVQQSLYELYASLPQDQFFRIHRRYIINTKQISRIDTQTHEIFFKDGNSLFFSRRYLDEFLDIFQLIK